MSRQIAVAKCTLHKLAVRPQPLWSCAAQASEGKLTDLQKKLADLEEAASSLQGNIDEAKEDVSLATEKGSTVSLPTDSAKSVDIIFCIGSSVFIPPICIY